MIRRVHKGLNQNQNQKRRYNFLAFFLMSLTKKKKKLNRYHIPRSWLQPSNNLLVIFEETGGNPLDISVKLHSTSSICAKVSESHYPPLHVWSHQDIVNGKVSINNAVPEIHLQCDNGQRISSITFASFGTPQGSCQRFSQGDCHAPNSFSVVSEVSIIQQEI